MFERELTRRRAAPIETFEVGDRDGFEKFRIVREREEILDPHRDLAQRLAMFADVFKFIGRALFRRDVGQPRRHVVGCRIERSLPRVRNFDLRRHLFSGLQIDNDSVLRPFEIVNTQ